jgi:hypothetical protein
MNCKSCEHVLLRCWTDGNEEVICSIDHRSRSRDFRTLTSCSLYREAAADGKDTKTPKPKAR